VTSWSSSGGLVLGANCGTAPRTTCSVTVNGSGTATANS
jgi:hypothetical protein